jgi:hypothetical protein
VNVYSQELEVYDSGFSKSLFSLIDAKDTLIDKAISQTDQKFYSIEIPELNTSVNVREDVASSCGILIF